MKVDKVYAASSYLMFRTVYNKEVLFDERYPICRFIPKQNRTPIHNSIELEEYLYRAVKEATLKHNAALMLSGGIDSAILAKFMPKGSVAYTLKCVVPGVEVVDETPSAEKYANECGLEHRVIEIFWEDFENLSTSLMKHKGAPIHSIEVQILKAAKQAKRDGFDTLIFGESADCLYGGLSKLLSRDWSVGNFIDRYSFLLPYKVLKEFVIETTPYKLYEKDGYVDVHKFLSNVFYLESVGSYVNACEVGGINLSVPYSDSYMESELDINRVRKGENKYLIREVFNRLYPEMVVPEKTPMPRATNEWLSQWNGPTRNEFWENSLEGLSGDQKWQVYALELFLNMLDER